MSHPRTNIRNAVKTRLETDIPSLSGKIFTTRIRPLYQAKLPCILIYTLKEPSEISTEAPREFMRSLQVVIEIVTKADDTLDDALDDLCLLVESSIFKEETFGGLVSDTILQDTEVSVLGEGDRLIGSAAITLLMPYFSFLPAEPGSPLDAFETAHVEFTPSEPPGADATDDLAPQQ